MYNVSPMKKTPLRAYRLYPIGPIKLIRNFESYPYFHGGTTPFETKERGWRATPWGWYIEPTTFKLEHPTACLISRGEAHPQYPNYVKAWMYTSTLHEIFKDDSRDTFICWVDPTCMYELK